MPGSSELFVHPVRQPDVNTVILALKGTLDGWIRDSAAHAAGCSITFAEQPVLVAETGGIQIAMGPFEHYLQAQPMIRERVGRLAIPGQTQFARQRTFEFRRV